MLSLLWCIGLSASCAAYRLLAEEVLSSVRLVSVGMHFLPEGEALFREGNGAGGGQSPGIELLDDCYFCVNLRHTSVLGLRPIKFTQGKAPPNALLCFCL